MKKSWNDLILTTPEQIDWRAELEETLAATGMNYAELAQILGLYVQHQIGKHKPVSPHFYRWLSGKAKPKRYLLYALRYIRLVEGQKQRPAPKAPRKRKE